MIHRCCSLVLVLILTMASSFVGGITTTIPTGAFDKCYFCPVGQTFVNPQGTFTYNGENVTCAEIRATGLAGQIFPLYCSLISESGLLKVCRGCKKITPHIKRPTKRPTRRPTRRPARRPTRRPVRRPT